MIILIISAIAVGVSSSVLVPLIRGPRIASLQLRYMYSKLLR